MEKPPHTLVWTKEKIGKYWNVYENEPLLLGTFFSEQASDWMISKVMQIIQKGMTILDVGLGTGKLVRKLARRGYNCFGIDVSPRSIERISKEIIREQLPIEVRTGDITNIPYESAKFDAVLLIEGLEHLLDEELIKRLQEVHRVLRDEGYIIITTPYKEAITRRTVLCPECHAIFHPMQHLHTFNKVSISRLLIHTGFKVLKAKSYCILRLDDQTLKDRIIAIARELINNMLGINQNHLLVFAVKY